MAKTLERTVEEFGVPFFATGSGRHGVCHVTFAENGLIWPGQLVACGDSHTCTYGAFGALAFGIGTTQVSHVLATQTLAMEKMKVKRINFNGRLGRGVTPKDAALYMIMKLGVKDGVGYAYEFGGDAVKEMSMEGRMTLCNLAVEGGARSGYVNPDEKTFAYLRDAQFAPKKDFATAVGFWGSVASDSNAEYDGVVDLDASDIKPMVTWGVNPEQTIPIDGSMPDFSGLPEKTAAEMKDAYNYMGIEPGKKIEGLPVDIVFIGSCTNGRLSDLEAAALVLKGRKVSVKTLVVPGSEQVRQNAEKLGLDKIFKDAGAEWRHPGCSMCLAMNPDRLEGTQRSASTSNRNFKGRQGSPTGRTHLMSPYTAAASAVEGRITDPRKYL
jgi:3-isopropylmalate/(R)-2-methylmalate dehydratase large subunit